MKYIITENKFEQVIVNYLNKYYGDLEEYRTDKHPNTIYFVKNDKAYMEQDVKDKDLWIDPETIWDDLEKTFSLNERQIELIIKRWVGNKFKLKGYQPVRARPMSMKKFK
jgi:hypothetical protein